MIGKNERLADRTKEIHKMLGTVGYFLIARHTAAAQFRHYVQRDDTLKRMMLRR